MEAQKSYVARTYNLSTSTDDKIKSISRRNHELGFGKVIEWAIEALFEKLYGPEADEPIPLREELDRR